MADIPPGVINHVRAQLLKDHPSGEVGVPSQRRSTEDRATSVETEPVDVEQGRLKGILSRLALRAAGPELSGD